MQGRTSGIVLCVGLCFVSQQQFRDPLVAVRRRQVQRGESILKSLAKIRSWHQLLNHKPER